VTPEWLRLRFAERPGWEESRLVRARILSLGQMTVLRRLQPAPRARLYTETRYSGFASPDIPLVDGARLPDGTRVHVQYERLRAGRAGVWVVQVRATIPSRLELAEPWAPGMRAWVNGKPVPLQINRWGQIAVPLDAGRHRVVVQYRPPLLAAGAVGTVVGGVVYVVLIFAPFGIAGGSNRQPVEHASG